MAKDRFCDPRRILVKPIQSLCGRYDYIFLDTAPKAHELFQMEGSPSHTFETTIGRAAVIPRVQKAGQPLFEADPGRVGGTGF